MHDIYGRDARLGCLTIVQCRCDHKLRLAAARTLPSNRGFRMGVLTV